MRPSLIVFGDPGIEVGLQLVDRAIDLLAEGDAVELVQHGAMEALADARWSAGSWSWCGCGRRPRPPDRARIRGFPGRRTQCRDRPAPGINGCRARHRTAPPGH